MSRIEALSVRDIIKAETAREALEAEKQHVAWETKRAEEERQKQERFEAGIMKVRKTGVISLFEALIKEEVVVGMKHEEVQAGTKNGEVNSIWKQLSGEPKYKEVPVMEDKFKPAKMVLGVALGFGVDKVYLPGITLKFDYHGDVSQQRSTGSMRWSEISAYLNPEGKLMINDVEVENNLKEVVARAIMNPKREEAHWEEPNAPG